MIVEDSSTFWIGLDDTDEREYGCTTFDFNDLLGTLSDSGCQINDARLVRLWPFAAQRTRGNAALAASVIFHDQTRLEEILDNWFESKYSTIESSNAQHSAQPTLLLTKGQIAEEIYWDTVQGHVDLNARMSSLSTIEHRLWHSDAGCMGLIGSSAAIAWRGTHDWTWECTAWRQMDGERFVPMQSVVEMAERFPATILNRDPNAKRSLISPRTPCPVLYGIRGEEMAVVLAAHEFLQNYPVEQSISHRVFRTNQATDDHLKGSHVSTVESVRIMKGGHVEVDVGEILLSFAKGGPVNRLAQSLQPGDKIEWYGLTDGHGVYHLEKLRIVSGTRNGKRPKCPCGFRYKSKGLNQKLKCPKCKLTTENRWDTEVTETDWLEPPISSRRHLSKPLGRIGKSEG